MNIHLLYAFWCLLIASSLSVAHEYQRCSKIEPLDERNGIYECIEYGSLYSGKNVKIGKNVRQLLFFDAWGAGWDEVRNAPFEGENGGIYHFIRFKVPYKNGKIDGSVFAFWEPLHENVRDYPLLYRRDNRYTYDDPMHFFYSTGVHYVSKYERGILLEETSYYESGELWWTVENKNGKRRGRFVSYHKSGEIEAEVEYKNGAEDGLKTWYNTDGSVEYYDVYEKGKFIEKRCPDGRRGNRMMKC